MFIPFPIIDLDDEASVREEEDMTPYSPEDLADDWEFKILRSSFGAFADPVKLKEILVEEGRAGWVLLEKFDDSRIRLKRRRPAADLDADLDFDAYRTTVPMPRGLVVAFGALLVSITLSAALWILLDL
jgi:hypothetical protein